jgi:hypothetical protein
MHGKGRLVRKYEERKPLRRHRCKEEDNIKLNLRVIECKSVKWINLAEHTVQWQTYEHSNLSLVCVKGSALTSSIAAI